VTQAFRNPAGGNIDRSVSLNFRFNGRSLTGHGGDSLASALLANGVRLLGRSFKYHRPRGVFSIGAEEPNALMRLAEGRYAEPNTRATQVELFDGLNASSQNHWPSLHFDLLAVNNLGSALLPAGFYYKTFMAPRMLWPWYEKLIRKAAGMGRAPALPDPDHYLACYAHCDVLVVGAGPTGLVAARAAALRGARVILVDENPKPGGWLQRERLSLDGLPGADWAETISSELTSQAKVRVLQRATAFGYYDHNMLAVVERCTDHLSSAAQDMPRQRLWRIFAGQVVLATGAIERPLIFANNDRPGVMLAGAGRGYLNQFAVRPGNRAAVFTNNDSGYLSARDLSDGGMKVAAVLDTRSSVDPSLVTMLRQRDIPLDTGHAVHDTRGGKVLESIRVGPFELQGGRHWLDCDVLCVSGGWTPAVHLHAQSGGRPIYSPEAGAFVPGESKQAERSAGAARGVFDLQSCLADGARAGEDAARRAGFKRAKGSVSLPRVEQETFPDTSAEAYRAVPRPASRSKQFLDLQDDVTTLDAELAHREGYVSVEHLKRYTTLGMGTDQGKTSNMHGMAALAQLRGEPIARVGTTTFRPPYTPVTLGTLAGQQTGSRVRPKRLTPMHSCHLELNAVFAPLGLWQRPQAYPRPGESLHAAAQREALAVRQGAGITDVSTLGKLEIHGPDAAQFLDRLYINNIAGLPLGRCRYGLMLREDGMIFDDGTATRLEHDRFMVTTTSGNAQAVLQHMEFYRDLVWPQLKVTIFDVTEQWAALAIAGPQSRALLQRVAPAMDLGAESLPPMHYQKGELLGAGSGKVRARVLRVSFSGEVAFEIYVPARHGVALWQALLGTGGTALTAYGMDALEVLRIEKGFLGMGAEADGRTSPLDLGLAGMLGRKKDFVGKAALQRPALGAPGRLQLVGLVPIDTTGPLPEGAQLIDTPARGTAGCSIGHISSAVHSPTLGHAIALALLKDGRNRLGDTVYVTDPVRRGEACVAARVGKPCFVDPGGERTHA